MLSAEEIREIDEELKKIPTKQAASIEAFKIVQRNRGWVSDDALADLAAYLGLSPDSLHAVATYYNLIFRKKVGRHIILLCDSISCWVTGYEDIRQHISQKLGIDFGQTTDDGKFTFLPSVCLGVCEHAPAMLIDLDLHWDLTTDKIDQILELYK